MKFEIESDAEAASRKAASLIAEGIAEAIELRRSFAIALSGGKTPESMLRFLANSSIDWSLGTVYQVDERIAPEGSAARNLSQLTRCFLDCIERPPSVMPMSVNVHDLAGAADDYASLLPAEFDVVHLGLGADGHTASLTPGDTACDSIARVALTGMYQGFRRMTLTFPVINSARRVVFLITGDEKTVAFQKLLTGDPGIPATRVRSAITTVVADRAAAG